MSIELSKIRRDGGTQSRAALNEATVAEYAEAMSDPDTVFPPVTVYFDGKDYWLADGFHRVAAWERIGRTDIPAEVKQGDRRRAILHSVAANSAHGLRRTNEDKRRAVLTLLEDAEWSAWSDREIARRCSVSHPFVAALRGAVTGKVTSDGEAHGRTYTTKHGTEAVMNTANIGSVSKQDQNSPSINSQENKGVAVQEAEITPIQEKPDQEIDAPAEDDATAKQRRELRKLTPEALIDDVIGLRAENDELRAKLKAAKAERDQVKEQLADLTDDDRATVIRKLQASLKNAENAKWRATEEQKRAMKQVYALKKRVEELEQAGIPLN